MKSDWNITTERLFLTPFAAAHVDALLAMNSDPEVMRYLGPPQTRADVEASIVRQDERWGRLGFGWWSIFERDSDAFVGAACLQHLAHIETNPLEIGWRLTTASQGKGYATEAGRAAMQYGFDVADQAYLCAVTLPENTPSQKVMQRLGMSNVGLQHHYDEEWTCHTFVPPQVLV